MIRRGRSSKSLQMRRLSEGSAARTARDSRKHAGLAVSAVVAGISHLRVSDLARPGPRSAKVSRDFLSTLAAWWRWVEEGDAS